MNKKLISLITLSCLSLFPLTATGCKEAKCEVSKEDFVVEKQINPTLESDGVIIKKCPECNELTYTTLPSLLDIVYTKKFIAPHFDENNNFVNGYYSYSSDAFGSYTTEYDFFQEFKQTIVFDSNPEQYDLYNYSKTNTYYFDENGIANIGTLSSLNTTNQISSYTLNSDGSFTFLLHDESKTYFLYSDNTFSQALQDNKELIEDLSDQLLFTKFETNENGYTTYTLQIEHVDTDTIVLAENTSTYEMPLNKSYYYFFTDSDELCLVQTKSFTNKAQVVSFEYLTLDYNSHSIIKSNTYSNNVLPILSISNFQLKDVLDSELAAPSTYGQNVTLRYNINENNYTLNIDGQNHTIDFNKISITQNVTYLDDYDTFYTNNTIQIKCNDDNYTFEGRLSLGKK